MLGTNIILVLVSRFCCTFHLLPHWPIFLQVLYDTYPKTMQRGVIAFLRHGIQGKFSSKFPGLAQITIHVHTDLKAITATQKHQFVLSLCWLAWQKQQNSISGRDSHVV